jgi:hypothetical protein
MAKSALEQIQELTAQMEKIKGEAFKEALAKAEAAVNELNALGYTYRLSQLEDRPSKTNRASGTRAPIVCKVCNFATVPGHNARLHQKHQGNDHKPFTDGELAALGLTKA